MVESFFLLLGGVRWDQMSGKGELHFDISAVRIRWLLPCDARPVEIDGLNSDCVEMRERSGEPRPSQYPQEHLTPQEGYIFAKICVECKWFGQAVAALPLKL
jgi:hypothetical protein